METLLVALLPYIIGSALLPLQITINILLLKSPRQGLLKASAYLAGMTTVRLLQGWIFGLILLNSSAASSEPGGKSPIVLTLLLVLGILLLITAYREWRHEGTRMLHPPSG